MTKAIGRALLAMLALSVLASVFYLYSRPDFMVQLANQVWGCF